MKSLRDPKRRPTHPGAILREDVLPALNLQSSFDLKQAESEAARKIAAEVRPMALAA